MYGYGRSNKRDMLAKRRQMARARRGYAYRLTDDDPRVGDVVNTIEDYRNRAATLRDDLKGLIKDLSRELGVNKPLLKGDARKIDDAVKALNDAVINLAMVKGNVEANYNKWTWTEV